ncbi:MAG: DNA-protecting protein DprA [Firmicutes bacterium]|nr:DNA-protecting protein DprA [Bacillota bacterium]
MSWSQRQYLIAFNMVPSIGGRRLLSIKEHFGSLEEAWHAPIKELTNVEGIGPKIAERFCTIRPTISPEREEKWADGLGARIITLADSSYPDYLKGLAVPPPVLYVRGKMPTQPGIAVVGTRRPSRVGIAQARQFSSYLASQGIPVVSGLARGIDFASHDEVVKAGGVTVAVLGSNLADLYPPEHRLLANRITEKGALITEFSSCCPTVPGNFPRRNRIIAACSQGVLVVQAGRTSGALHTVDWALELGIEVWAIPGEISDPLRQGNHRLIRQGAALVSDPTELIEGGVHKGMDNGNHPSLEVLYDAGYSPNEIAATLDRPVHDILSEISLLQVKRGSKMGQLKK